MKNNRIKLFAKSFFTLVALFYSRSLYACDCIMYPVEKYIDTSECIITAEVIKIINKDSMQYYGNSAILRVTKVYKGKMKSMEIIEFGSDGSDCSLKFEQNKKYFLFCCQRNSKYYVYHCSYSDDLNTASKNVRKVKRYIVNHPLIER
jgi:hypothetical protein